MVRPLDLQKEIETKELINQNQEIKMEWQAHFTTYDKEISANATLSKRQDSSTASVDTAPSVIKLLECKAKELNASAAALRVAQSVLVRQS